MIVVNKRYYDYDYDNNTIIMFDAEDVGLTLDFNLNEALEHNEQTMNTKITKSQQQQQISPSKDAHHQNSQSMTAGAGSSHLQSQSTETVPDDIIDPSSENNKKTDQTPTNSSNNNSNLDEIKESEATEPSKDMISNNLDDDENKEPKEKGNISWISSSSPKGLRKIPYALQVAHSYTINKLEVQLTTLVDTKTIIKQQQEQAAKLARAQQDYIRAQQLQQAEYMAQQQAKAHAHHLRHGHHGHHHSGHGHGHHPRGSPHSHHPSHYPYGHPPPPHHPHGRGGGHHPPHHPPHGHGHGHGHPHPVHHPGYPPHPQYVHPGHYPHGRYPPHHPHGHPPPPHGYHHPSSQRKQEASSPKSPSSTRGYYGSSQQKLKQNQYMTYNTDAVQQQNKSK